MIRSAIVFMLFTSSAFAGGNNYWTIEIPVVTGASNVLRERDDRFYIISSSYEVVIEDTEKLYDFYNDFFEKLGWDNPMKDFPRTKNEYKEKWNSYRSAFNHEGLPESSYASIWKSKAIPASGTVNLTLTSFIDGKFSAKVKVIITPEVDTSPLFQLQKLMIGDPKNIFILHSATGGNPFEIDKINPKPSGMYKNNEMVKEYYGLVESIFKQYREFGDKYVQQ